MELILASNSPRRKELLEKYGFKFKIVPSNFNEDELKSSHVETVKSYAFNKALDVFNRLKQDDVVVLGADTIVYLDGKILGKPKNVNQAISMLSSLSGKTHEVITAYSLIRKDKILTDYVTSKVTFNVLDKNLILEYVNTGSPLDKAGAYGIQDGFDLVKEIEGSFNNVVGLPIEIIKDIIFDFIK